MRLASRQIGFTLIELMIVVAIISVLAAVAIPAYQNYLATANMAKVMSQYEEAKSLTDTTYVQGHVQSSLNQPLTIPTDTAGWISIYNSQGANAPGGGLAFIAGGSNATTGQIGVTASGTFPDTAQVVIALPAYQDLTAATTTIVAADSM